MVKKCKSRKLKKLLLCDDKAQCHNLILTFFLKGI